MMEVSFHTIEKWQCLKQFLIILVRDENLGFEK